MTPWPWRRQLSRAPRDNPCAPRTCLHDCQPLTLRAALHRLGVQKCGDGAVGIILHGLVSKPEHNGKPARVQGWDAGRQRFEVRLSDGKMLLVKPDNVRSDNAELAVNATARLAGLKDPEFKGKAVVLQGFDAASNRWAVLLQDGTGRRLITPPQFLVPVQGLGSQPSTSMSTGAHVSALQEVAQLADTARKQGQYERAIQLYTQGLAISRQIGHRQGEGACLGGLGDTFLQVGQF